MSHQQSTTITLRTKRLILRPLIVDDANRVAELAGDWDVARMTGQIPYPYTPNLAVDWITSFEGDEQAFAITKDQELIGVCGYRQCQDGSAEIGYWLGKPYWGRGFATEAVSSLIDHCFNAMKIDKVTCAHFTDNDLSARVIEKLGFARIGEEACWCEARRRDVDAVSYELSLPS